MRTILVVLLLLAQPSLAAECLLVSAGSPPTIVLRGVIEQKPASATPGSVEIFLKLSTPMCVQAVGPDGLPFKNEHVTSIMVGFPDDLANRLGALQPRARVTLRAKLWYPTFNEKSERIDKVTFRVEEVL